MANPMARTTCRSQPPAHHNPLPVTTLCPSQLWARHNSGPVTTLGLRTTLGLSWAFEQPDGLRMKEPQAPWSRVLVPSRGPESPGPGSEPSALERSRPKPRGDLSRATCAPTASPAKRGQATRRPRAAGKQQLTLPPTPRDSSTRGDQDPSERRPLWPVPSIRSF